MEKTLADLYADYMKKMTEVEKLRHEVDALRWQMIALQPVKLGQRARRKGDPQEYLVFKVEFWQVTSKLTGEPTFWYTLTKPKKDGTLPLKAISPEYAASYDIELVEGE